MADDGRQAMLATWAASGLPARLDVGATAKLLGFGEHDVQILMAVGRLRPLGDPAPNAPKWFAAVEMLRLAGDGAWLHRATQDISRYWRRKRARRLQRRCAPAAIDGIGRVAAQAKANSARSNPDRCASKGGQ